MQLYCALTSLYISEVHANALADIDTLNNQTPVNNYGHYPPPPGLDLAQFQTDRTKVFEDLFNNANTLLKENNVDEAISLYQHAINLYPSNAQAYYNLGIALNMRGKKQEATEAFEKAIAHNPFYTKALVQLGKIFQEKQQLDVSIEYYTRALKNEPDLIETRLGIARVLSEKNQFEQAAIHLEHVLAKKPQETQLLFELANAFNMANKIDQCLEIYYQLLEKNPNNPSILYNVAYTLKKLGKIEEAMPYYKAVLEKNPLHAEANFSLGLAYLMMGDWENGWEQYEWRWKRSTQGSTKRMYTKPTWDGSDLHGKTIYLYAEQGLGDTFQFIRYAQIAKQKGGTVIVSVQKPLVQLLSLCPYIDRVISLHEQPKEFDCHAPLMSLPHILKTRVDTTPKNTPYLYAHPGLEKKWADKLAHDTNFKIGICWQGNSQYSTPFLRAVVAAKSIALHKLNPLAQVPGVSIYSLQKQTGEEQLQSLPFVLHTFDNDFDTTNGRFMDTAAVMKNLDLVITIDTSICHLAAALGVPTWNMLPNPPDWRWMLNRPDTPWYPNMRLFRQPSMNDWDSVVARVTDELARTVQEKNREKNVYRNKIVPNHDNKAMQNIDTPAKRLPQYQQADRALNEQLVHELATVDQKLLNVCTSIRNLPVISPDDQYFIDHIRMVYYLDEIRTTLKAKIKALA